MNPEKKIYLTLECAVLFFILPIGLYFVRFALQHKIIPLVWILSFACYFYLHKHTDFNWHHQKLSQQKFKTELRNILLIFLPCAGILSIGAWLLLPSRFLAFPRTEPGLWLLIMTAYPFAAAFPQEIIFRAFFFYRYKTLFQHPGVWMVVNGFAFGFAHVFYGNWWAPTLATLGGFLFASRYLRSRSVWMTTIEHGLWGQFLFTIGYGWYFYNGNIQ